ALAPLSTAPKPPALPALTGWRVLVVDDVAINRQIVSELLSLAGAQVKQAHSIEMALTLLWEQRDCGQPCQLLVLDSQMPDDNSLELLDWLIQEPDYARLPMVLLSSGERRCYELAEASDGRIVCLLKPIRRQVLWKAVNALIGAAGSEQGLDSKRSRTRASRFLTNPHLDALSILVADDSKDNIMLIRAYLKQTQHQLEIVENGALAVERFKQSHFDLVFMDVQMPVMDGYTATGLIRQWEREQDYEPTPIIALTANALKEDEQRSLDAGCTGHLTKPIRKGMFLAAVQHFIYPPLV
ncbi:MAG: response regulator, partial [Candidatus Contendobacter sp.]|nr:response regulator [Candidatus Contendobacter sp.]